MATAATIEARIVELQKQLKETRRKEKQRDAEQVLQLLRRSGLSMLDLKNLIQSTAGGASE